MIFYDETKPFYLETNASGVELRAGLLQTRSVTNCPGDTGPENSILRPIVFMIMSLSSERRNSNMEREALGILHGLKKFHDYYFAMDGNIITDHKLLIAIFKKDLATLS